MNATASQSTSKAPFYIPSLDGIRALAVMIVFVAHAGLGTWVPGGFGVTVFFFLSGYLITTLLRMEYDSSGTISLKDFYLRRVLRIFPNMYTVVLVASALTMLGILSGTLQLPAVIAQAAHLTNYYVIATNGGDGRAPGTGILWSLAVEEHFYLAFPLLYLIGRRVIRQPRQQVLALAITCGLVLLWRCWLVFVAHAPEDRTYIATDTRIDSIIFGCILAIYGNPVLDRVGLGERWWKWLLVPLGIAALLVTFIVRSPQFHESFRYTIQGLALFPLFIVAIQYPQWGPCRLLNWNWVRFVGVLSYSMYLTHHVVLAGIGDWSAWPRPIQGVCALVITLVLAAAMYYLIEKPCQRLRKRLSHIGRPSAREATPRPGTPRAAVHAEPALALPAVATPARGRQPATEPY